MDGSSGVRVVDAANALWAVMKNPEDTVQVFRLFEAVSGGPPERLEAQFAATRAGARLLAERPSIGPRLVDHAALRALPAGSVGRAYLEFMERDGLTADYLARVAAEARATREESYLAQRMRETHDLWHVVTGYGGDLLGEACVLAFTFGQTYAPGVGLLVAVGLAKAGEPDARRLILDAFARGASAAWLPVAPWEELLAEPLESVRARLRVGPPRAYEPFYARDLPRGGLLARAEA